MKKILLPLLVVALLFSCKGDPKTNPVIMEDSGDMAPNREFGEKPSLFEVLETNPAYNGFLKLVNMANMFDELQALDNVTVFAPDDFNVNTILNNELDGLSMQERQKKLRNIINYHIVDRVITGPVLKSSVLPADKEVYRLKTKQGAYLSFVKEDGEIVITDELMNEHTILKLDTEATNGAVHNISGLLIPQDDDSVKNEDND